MEALVSSGRGWPLPLSLRSTLRFSLLSISLASQIIQIHDPVQLPDTITARLGLFSVELHVMQLSRIRSKFLTNRMVHAVQAPGPTKDVRCQIGQEHPGRQVGMNEEGLWDDAGTSIPPGRRAQEIGCHLVDKHMRPRLVQFIKNDQPTLSRRQGFQKVEVPLEQVNVVLSQVVRWRSRRGNVYNRCEDLDTKAGCQVKDIVYEVENGSAVGDHFGYVSPLLDNFLAFASFPLRSSEFARAVCSAAESCKGFPAILKRFFFRRFR